VFIAQKDSTISQAISCWSLTAEAGFDSKIFHLRFMVDKDDFQFFRSISIFPVLVSFSYRGADKSLTRPTARCILFDG